jgi:glycerol-3-phosphate cytidylyltransferase
MRIGFTCSTFDLFHAGHVAMLKEAKSSCDFLIVGLQNDPTVDREWKNKPIQSLFERYIQLDGCKYVDQIIPYSTEAELIDILKTYKIDVRFVGEEYRGKQFTGCDLQIPIHYNSRSHSFSTTELRKRVAVIENAKTLKEQ